jgi:hypothetical protein
LLKLAVISRRFCTTDSAGEIGASVKGYFSQLSRPAFDCDRKFLVGREPLRFDQVQHFCRDDKINLSLAKK